MSIQIEHERDAELERFEERQKDAAYERDFAVMVQVYRTELAKVNDYAPPTSVDGYAVRVLGRLSRVLALRSCVLSHEYATLDFADDYGVEAVLRALARAIQDHKAGTPRPEAD